MTGSKARAVLLVATNLLGVCAFAWPFVLPAAAGGSAHAVDAPAVLAVLLLALGGLLFVELGRGGLGPKAVALIGVLGALMAALRLPGFVAGFSAMYLVVLIAGNAFGPGFGFVLGAIGTFASGLFVGGVGPWLPFQMVAVGWIGMGAGVLPRAGSWRVRTVALAAFGAVAGFLFGAVMNLWFWPFTVASGDLSWAPELGAAANLKRYGAFYLATSLAWDVPRALGNAVLVIVAGRPLLATLDRAARRMRLHASDWPGNGAGPIIVATSGSRPGGRGSARPGSRKVRTPQSRALGKSQAG